MFVFCLIQCFLRRRSYGQRKVWLLSNREQNFGTFDVWFGPGLPLAMILPAVPMVYLGKLNQYGMYPNISIMLTSTKCPAAIEIWCGQNPTGPRFGLLNCRSSSRIIRTYRWYKLYNTTLQISCARSKNAVASATAAPTRQNKAVQKPYNCIKSCDSSSSGTLNIFGSSSSLTSAS